MTKAYYIVQLSRVGNIGEHEIMKIGNQPKEGFVTEDSAEAHLLVLGKSKKYPFDRTWYSFAIMRLYHIVKE